MKTTDFLSNSTYVMLPRKSNPKVYLPLGDSNTIQQAFKLYNPFSKKAKLLKYLSQFLCLYMKPVARILLPTVQGKKSEFLGFIEKRLAKNITSSVDAATVGDKLVLQLQSQSGIVGYLKYPISELGEKRLLNERRAITLLSDKNLIPALLMRDDYEEVPFIVLQNLEGTIGEVSSEQYRNVLEKFKKTQKFKLKDHPRVFGLMEKLNALHLKELKNSLEYSINSSSKSYHEVYEHGDFASWNLMQTKDGLIPFDFEYFEEKGLEHLDEIKFHYQIQYLLQHRRGIALIEEIASELNIEEFNSIFKVFLVKEIVNKAQAEEPYDFESELLALVP